MAKDFTALDFDDNMESVICGEAAQAEICGMTYTDDNNGSGINDPYCEGGSSMGFVDPGEAVPDWYEINLMSSVIVRPRQYWRFDEE